MPTKKGKLQDDFFEMVEDDFLAQDLEIPSRVQTGYEKWKKDHPDSGAASRFQLPTSTQRGSKKQKR
jgi:hypothetical protein